MNQSHLHMAESNSLFCNLDEKCVGVNDDCVTLPAAAIEIQKTAIKEMVNEFIDRLKEGSKQLINVSWIKQQIHNPDLPLISLLTSEFMKYDTRKFELGESAKEVVVEKSPYANVLSLILSQSDFVKNQ